MSALIFLSQRLVFALWVAQQIRMQNLKQLKYIFIFYVKIHLPKFNLKVLSINQLADNTEPSHTVQTRTPYSRIIISAKTRPSGTGASSGTNIWIWNEHDHASGTHRPNSITIGHRRLRK